jgi:general secretion pathway protein J
MTAKQARRRGARRWGFTPPRARGFTLIELMCALLILSLLALMSFRGLGAVLDGRDHVRRETEKWRSVAAFFSRFQLDVQLAAPRPVRSASGAAPAWRGRAGSGAEFSRFASVEGQDAARRVAYHLNESHEIEILLWPGLDLAPGAQPARYALLAAVAQFELQYLDPELVWADAWPRSELDAPLPQAVRVRIVLASGEDLVRVFALK